MKDTIKIVLTGGSNSGKTELIERIAEVYNEDYIVAVVPESATELLKEGHKPDKNFQRKIANRQVWNEKEVDLDVKMTESLFYFEHKPIKGTIILYDRSFMDQLAYCSKDEWQNYMSKVLDTTTFDESIEVLNVRYDVVIHLESNAKFRHVAEGRLETQEEAIELEKRTLKANQYFNDLYYVERKENIDDKFNEVLDIIDFELNVRDMK